MKIKLQITTLLSCIAAIFLCNCHSSIDRQQQFQRYIDEENWYAVEKFVLDYMNSDEFIAHTAGFSILPEIITHSQLLELSEQLVLKCIEKNTIDNLKRLGSENADHQKQNIDFVYYYSQYAWILWKKKKYSDAKLNIEKAIEYQVKTGLEIQGRELLRLGIIEYYKNNNAGWQKIQKSLLVDSNIEKQDNDYTKALENIMKIEIGSDVDIEQYIETYRQENRESVPELTLISLDWNEVKLHEQEGKILFVNFFSPNCGSCRYELPKIKKIYDQYSQRDDVMFLFILDKPNMKNESIKLLKKYKYDNVPIFIIKNGSAWDHIKGEPTTWIIDRNGKFVYMHLGYKPGIEVTYREELSKLL